MNKKILVVDDEPEIVNSIVRFLRLEGLEAEGETDPVAALEIIKKDNYLIVVSDIQMPQMRGTELLKKLKEYNGMIQVIILTGYVTIDNILTCLSLGANDCFFKPLKDNTEFLDAVKASVAKLERWQAIIGELVKLKKS